MADPYSMTVNELAGKLLSAEHADILREAVRMILAELMECEVTEAAGAAPFRALARAPDAAQRLPPPHFCEAKAAGKDRIHANRTAYAGPVPDAYGGAGPIRSARRSAGAE
ncbi:MAG: hypothetical protein ACYCX3_04425 [Thermoleophilia bacterium]